MPSTKNYETLGKIVESRPGAKERLEALRRETLLEIALYQLRRAWDQSQAELADLLGITQSAVSQIEHAVDIKLSTLRNYLDKLGAELRIVAVFKEDDVEYPVPLRIGEPPVREPAGS
jgi:transcriptional regulator with XRE-family HTH domain